MQRERDTQDGTSGPELQADERLCPACGAPAPDRFCPRCGAEQDPGPEPELPPLRHFVAEAARELTELDSQLLGTAAALLRRPGELTRAYGGRSRRRYLQPLKLFFLANVLYFFIAGFSSVNTFSTPLRYQLTTPPARGVKAHFVARTLVHHRTDVKGLEPAWNAITDAHARSLVILMVPLYALVFGGLLAWTRRRAVFHLVFATHFMTFYMLVLSAVAAALPAILLAYRRGLLGVPTDLQLSLFILALLSVYTYASVRRAYATGRLAALGVTIAAGVLAFPVLLVYRFLLFLTVVWAMS